MNSAPHILIADDHPLFRIALTQAIGLAFPGGQIDQAGSIDEVQQVMQREQGYDLLLLDLHMPGAHGFSGLVHLRGQYPEIPVVIVSGNDQDKVIGKALKHGASGFIPKSTDLPEMAEAIRAIMAGAVWTPRDYDDTRQRFAEDEISIAETVASLTPQQFRVFTHLSGGMLNKQIAYEMGVAEGTVKAHVTGILKKFGAYSRSQLIIAAQKLDAEETME